MLTLIETIRVEEVIMGKYRQNADNSGRHILEALEGKWRGRALRCNRTTKIGCGISGMKRKRTH